jgi:hypothetical protein
MCKQRTLLPLCWLPADDLSSYVQLHKSPSDPVFYEVNYHCYGIVPALSNPAYYTSKLTSAVITSLMTGALLTVVIQALPA